MKRTQRILIAGPEGSGRRTLFHALGGVTAKSSPTVFVDAFKRSLGEFRGASADVWIQLVHGGLESERLDRERDLMATADGIIFVCDARAERLCATRQVIGLAARTEHCVFAITHAAHEADAERLRRALGVDSPHWLRVGRGDPLGALAVMKIAARLCSTLPGRDVAWPVPHAVTRLPLSR